MDVMETIQTILAICGGISVIGGAAAVIHKWIAPAVKLNDRVETLERHDKRDYEAMQEIKEGTASSWKHWLLCSTARFPETMSSS